MCECYCIPPKRKLLVDNQHHSGVEVKQIKPIHGRSRETSSNTTRNLESEEMKKKVQTEEDIKALDDTELFELIYECSNSSLPTSQRLLHLALVEQQNRKINQKKQDDMKADEHNQHVIRTSEQLITKFDSLIKIISRFSDKPAQSFGLALIFAVATGTLINLLTNFLTWALPLLLTKIANWL